MRRPPRGVKKEDFAKRDYYDVWLPLLAPSQPLVTRAMKTSWTQASWAKFEKAYRAEMRKAEPAQLIALLAKLSHAADFSVGCYCEDEERCHRSVLKALFAEHGARLVRDSMMMR